MASKALKKKNTKERKKIRQRRKQIKAGKKGRKAHSQSEKNNDAKKNEGEKKGEKSEIRKKKIRRWKKRTKEKKGRERKTIKRKPMWDAKKIPRKVGEGNFLRVFRLQLLSDFFLFSFLFLPELICYRWRDKLCWILFRSIFRLYPDRNISEQFFSSLFPFRFFLKFFQIFPGMFFASYRH